MAGGRQIRRAADGEVPSEARPVTGVRLPAAGMGVTMRGVVMAVVSACPIWTAFPLPCPVVPDRAAR